MRPSHPGMLNRVALSTYLPLLSAKVIKQYLMPAALNHSKSKWDREREREREMVVRWNTQSDTKLICARSLTCCRLKCNMKNGVALK